MKEKRDQVVSLTANSLFKTSKTEKKLFILFLRCLARRRPVHVLQMFVEMPSWAICSFYFALFWEMLVCSIMNCFETSLCFAGRLLPHVQRSWNLSRKYHQINWDIKFQSYCKREKSNFIIQCSPNGMSNDLNLDIPNKLILNASIIYCVSAAMGHNKVNLTKDSLLKP
jgi:hypothetical protein